MDKKNSIDDDISPLSPEEIKAIGEIELGPSKQEQFLNAHYKKLIVGGVVLMVAISAGICFASFRQQHNNAGAHQLFASAKVVSPGDVADPASYDATALSLVKESYGDTDSAETAELMECLSLLEGETTAEGAVARLEALAASTSADLITARALSAVAAYHMSNGKGELATATWKKVAQLPDNAYTALAYVSLGDLARNAGDIETARSYYNMLATKCPSSPLTRSQVGELRLMLLDADSPEPVKPEPVAQPQLPTSPYAPLAPGQQPGGSGLDLSMPSFPGSTGQPATPGL